MTQTHTPLPWAVFNGVNIYPANDTAGRFYIADCDPESACLEEMALAVGEHPFTDSTFEMKKADATFIVTACNSYYDNQALIASQAAEIARLREALKKIADPKQLASHGDPTALRDVARAALEPRS